MTIDPILLRRSLLATVIATSLTACGGSDSSSSSGGGDEEPDVATYLVTTEFNVGGSLTPEEQEVEEGSTTEFTVTVDNGFQLETISGCDGTLEDEIYTTGTIDAECTVTAEFDETVSLTGKQVSFSSSPSLNEDVTVAIESEGAYDEAIWALVHADTDSSVDLVVTETGDSATFSVAEAGSYRLTVSSPDNDSAIVSDFEVAPDLPFNAGKVNATDPNATADETIGVVVNQQWIKPHTSLSKAALEQRVASYDALTVVGYNKIQGMLVEYDESSIQAKEQLELLKLEKGIRGVNARTYQGPDAPIEFLVPGDGSDFSDGGDNWYLETDVGVNFVEAWDITTGSESVLVGVLDAGYFRNHEELASRYAASYTNVTASHGTGVAATIFGESDNDIGVTGINHKSRGVLALAGVNEYISTAEYQSGSDDVRVRVVNNSWGPMGNGPSTIESGIIYSRPFREIAEQYSDILHVWASGNNGTYASTQNGALHLNDEGAEQRLENVMVVAAFGIDGNLLPYSDFGSTVDIAAPSEFKGASLVANDGSSQYYSGNGSVYGYCFSGGFNGTSAAAPVVTGTASLIFSLNPALTAKQVKQIMVDSATDYVTHRHIDSSNCASANAETEALERPIPIVNPKAALELAQSMMSADIALTASVADPFKAAANVEVNVIDESLEFISADWVLEVKNGEGEWVSLSSGSATEQAFTTDISDAGEFRITVDALLEDAEGAEVTTSQSDVFVAAPVVVKTRDTINLESLPSAAITLESKASGAIEGEVLTSDNGQTTLYLKPDSYKLFAAVEGYADGVASVAISHGAGLDVSLNLTPDEFDGVGSIAGIVTDANGEVLPNATVRISGGEQTNGFFASASTDQDGYYAITNISKLDSSGEPIKSFFMESSANGYMRAELSEVIVLAAKERTENFTLEAIPEPEPGDVYFGDDGETADAGWLASGLWNRYDFGNNDPVNTLVDSGYVSLAPDEEGPQAALPEVYGDFAWWYGSEATGTFIGTQREPDQPLSGGRSVEPNSGSLTSPEIDLTNANSPVLSFETWWEIESVNPNESGFDLMEVMLSTDGGQSFTVVRKLNPYVDPNDAEREPKPFSSAGFNRKPVWVSELMDLSEYVGQSIVLRFNFRTNDTLYNGFRGWIIDDVMVYEAQEEQDGVIGTSGALNKSSLMRGGKKISPKATEFHRIHRLPKEQPQVEVKERSIER
ncbi:S8 family serine peptidase [Idiomarina sp. PL1-037]|uniref:S8 family serine peptidase n=1 Tax=Idiomarina sp. PL1-037 TaxID=3095365 RepID=UPI002ACC2E72|nr:S8 family serine peptidase [Idiomarina sp. PL1-037]WQC53525.1 S8 family serine peptidase [Idiomarina sp. PL1-037]